MSNNENYKENFNPEFYMVEVYKKWHRRGFLSVKYWVKESKVQVEVGTIDPQTKKCTSSSQAYGDAYSFLSYLRAEINGNMNIVFPDFPNTQFQYFGGSIKPTGEVISRVFTSTYWRSNRDSPADPTARAFSCGTYAGRKNAQGAFEPDYKSAIDFNRVKVSLAEMAELFERLNASVHAYAVQEADLHEVFAL